MLVVALYVLILGRSDYVALFSKQIFTSTAFYVAAFYTYACDMPDIPIGSCRFLRIGISIPHYLMSQYFMSLVPLPHLNSPL